MELNVQYIRDLPISAYGEWTDAQSHDWMHPCNGPLPTHHGMLECLGGRFIAATWDDYNALFVFLYLQDEEEQSEASRIVGGIPRTYRWALDENVFHCHDSVLHTPEWKGDQAAWEKELMKNSMIESVKLAIRIPIGIRTKTSLERLLRPANDLLGNSPRRSTSGSPSTPSATRSRSASPATGSRSTRRLLPSLRKDK